MAKTFKVICDDGEWFVADASVGAYSFAMVVSDMGSFGSKVDAVAAAKELAASKKDIAVRMMETPSRFESVADTVYGAAWE